MGDLFSIYKKWREQIDSGLTEDEAEDADKRAFMRYAKLKNWIMTILKNWKCSMMST